LLQSVFSKAGLILEDHNSQPKIKLYTDVQGSFKGEALVTYLQEASVELAVRLLDQTELELGKGEGVMSVKKAEWGSKEKTTAPKEGEGENVASGSGSGIGYAPKPRDQQKAKQGKKAAALRQCVLAPLPSFLPSTNSSSFQNRRKLGDWSDDESSTAAAAAAAKKYRGMVVLEGMFTLKELEEDPALLLDLKEDVREECERLGEVTNVTLYDVRSFFLFMI
jgi:HIV Tat-specific factor 1